MRRLRRKKKGVIALFSALFLAVFFAIYSISNKMLVDIGAASYQGVLSSASYYAIEKSLSNNYAYEELIKVYKNDNGEITMITTDAFKFNGLTSLLANYVSEYLTDYINEGVEVPIGVFTGIKILAGYGKKIKMPLIAINSVKCEVISTFESAGINQTRHTLYLDVTPDVAIVTRVSTKKLIDNIKVLLYDNLIVGKVPEVYLSGTVFSAEKFV